MHGRVEPGRAHRRLPLSWIAVLAARGGRQPTDRQQRENASNLKPRNTPVTTIAASETYIGTIVSPDRVMRSTIFRRSRSSLIRYRTVMDVPWVPRSARTEAMCRKSSHLVYIARRITGRIARPDPARAV